MIEKSAIKKSFSRAARTYDAYASLQKEAAGVVASLLSRFAREAVPVTVESGVAPNAPLMPPMTLLDAGSGTGALSAFLKDEGCRIFGVDIALPMLECSQESLPWTGGMLATGDLEALPFKDASFDAVASSLALQWTEPELSFREAARVLKPGGLFVFSTLGPATLHELRDCLGSDALARFTGMIEALRLIEASGFETVFSEERLVTKNYPTLRDLLITLKQIGASPVSKGRMGPAASSLKKAEADYLKRFGGEGSGVRATYELIYIVARKRA
ncbi:MAG: methyltransferase domain-containing protein [Deltaproteobacteria bacterium]|nr:methyltransferase domain-containing protein [Deltaproteobacteria bacterium]